MFFMSVHDPFISIEGVNVCFNLHNYKLRKIILSAVLLVMSLQGLHIHIKFLNHGLHIMVADLRLNITRNIVVMFLNLPVKFK